MGLIPFGKILKAHGLLGEVKILPFSREFDNLSRLNRIFIQRDGEDAHPPREFKITRKRFQKEFAILKLEEVDGINAANELQGCVALADTSDFLQTEEGEYYWFQLIGLDVYTTEGDRIGRVENLIDRTPQSVLVVKKDESEFLIPMVDAIVKEINLKDSKIVIAAMKGLID